MPEPWMIWDDLQCAPSYCMLVYNPIQLSTVAIYHYIYITTHYYATIFVHNLYILYPTMRYHLLDTWSNSFVTLVVVIPPTRSSFQVGKLTPLRPHSLTSYWGILGSISTNINHKQHKPLVLASGFCIAKHVTSD
jgi:hypothetical protein